jgi:hypothetical protein
MEQIMTIKRKQIFCIRGTNHHYKREQKLRHGNDKDCMGNKILVLQEQKSRRKKTLATAEQIMNSNQKNWNDILVLDEQKIGKEGIKP